MAEHTGRAGWARAVARRWRAVLAGLYVALLLALTLLLWWARVAGRETPPPAANGHGQPQDRRPAVPLVALGAPWWRGDAAGVAGAYTAGGVGMLAGVVVAAWRRRPPSPRAGAAAGSATPTSSWCAADRVAEAWSPRTSGARPTI